MAFPFKKPNKKSAGGSSVVGTSLRGLSGKIHGRGVPKGGLPSDGLEVDESVMGASRGKRLDGGKLVRILIIVVSVLAILPLISMLIIFGLFDGLTQQGRWREFFGIFGLGVSAVGLIALFLVKDAPELKPRRGGGLAELLYGLRPQVIRENPELYLAFAAFCLFSVAVQVFFPYLIIYIQNYLGITDYAIVLGVVLLIASAVSVLSGRFIDRFGKLRFCFPAALVMLLGLLGMYFVRGMAGVMLAGTVMMSGYMLLSAALSATIRDWTPRGKVGHFQGIRMIFAVLLPMVIGPSLGAAVIRGSKSTYVELGQVKAVPTPGIYLAAAAVLLLTAIPVLILRKREKETRHS